MRVEHAVTEAEKTCVTCREALPADAEFFFQDKRKPDGLRSVCKACYYEIPSVKNRRKQVKS